MLMFRSKTDEYVHVADLSGHVAKVGPDWVELPEILHSLALQKGCITATKSEIKAAEHELREPVSVSNPKKNVPERSSPQDKLYDLLLNLSTGKDNSRGYLTAAGAPNVEKINKALGYNHNREDMLGMWRKLHETGDVEA